MDGKVQGMLVTYVTLMLGRFFGGGKNSSWVFCEDEKFRCVDEFQGLTAE